MSSEDDDEDDDDDDDGKNLVDTIFKLWRQLSLIAYQSKYDETRVGIVHWQHACCTQHGQQVFQWRYVARALAQRVDALMASHNCNQRAQALEPTGNYLFA
jgi:hypothetical protein